MTICMSKKPISAMLVFFVFISISSPAMAITRGRFLKEVFETLGIPPTAAKGYYSDVPSLHPFFKYIETARALGIIFPGDRFHPDMQITRAESLMFIFKSMGWTHEATLADQLFPTISDTVPTYIAPYLILARRVQPPVPGKMIMDPTLDLLDSDLKLLIEWISKCREKMVWEEELTHSGFTLMIHRQGIGTPPETWSVKLRDFEKLDMARSMVAILEKIGYNPYISNNACSFSVLLGPFDHYGKAWKGLKAISSRYAGTVVPTGKKSGNALFWSAIVSDPSVGHVSILTAPEIGGYRLPLSHMAQNSEAIGAINGGYFAGKYPIGTLVRGGFPLSPSYGKRSAVAWNTNGKTSFSEGSFKTFLQVGDLEIPISFLNRKPAMNSIALFTRLWGTFATSIPSDAMELTVKHNKVTSCRPSSMSNHFLPENGYIIVARGNTRTILENIEIGSPVSLEIRWNQPSMKQFSDIIQGGPLLLKNGIPVLHNEGLANNVTDIRHPRTIVGSDGERMFWIVIDGRNSWHSSGLTLNETRKFAMDLGLVQALNLDGGGSSELWWKDMIVNSIPGGKERALPYCIVFGQSQKNTN